MDGQMKVNGDLVRALREEKAWSQEHLARASGVSERTIQRVEIDGVGSAETRLALAAALGVPVSALLSGASHPIRVVDVARHLPFWGWVGYGVGLTCLIGVVCYGYFQGSFPVRQITASVLPWLAVLGIGAGVMAARVSWLRERTIKR